jgi:hypothetical protein
MRRAGAASGPPWRCTTRRRRWRRASGLPQYGATIAGGGPWSKKRREGRRESERGESPGGELSQAVQPGQGEPPRWSTRCSWSPVGHAVPTALCPICQALN